MKELLNNPLMKTFEIAEKDSSDGTDTPFSILNEVMDAIANSNTDMLDVNIQDEEVIDEDNLTIRIILSVFYIALHAQQNLELTM